MSASPKIAIIGAGPGGLTLANLLRKSHISFIVYEFDASSHERGQGGTLDLHPQEGQLALREAGLWDQFVEHARPEGDVMKVVASSGEVLWDGNGPDARVITEEKKFDHRPEIDRAALKDILLASLAPDCLRWGKKLMRVVPAGPETSDLHFADGSVEKDFDLVIGADGAWSKVRQLLSELVPHYSGISAVELWAQDADEKHQWMSKYAGRGSCFSFSEDRTIQIQRVGDGALRTYACLRKPESFIRDCGIDWTKPDAARREYVGRYFGDCGEDLKRMMLESSDALTPRAFYMLPVGFRWESRPGVTLLGDAAHLMTPFAGLGVNVAMADALDLWHAIISYMTESQDQDLAATIQDYESKMFLRGDRCAQKTMNNLELHFSAAGNEYLVGRLRMAYA